MNGQTDKWTDKQTDILIDRQTDKGMDQPMVLFGKTKRHKLMYDDVKSDKLAAMFTPDNN